MIDLHVHSTFSDGSYTPEELAGMGKDAGLSAMALTDHDTTNGIDRFMAACESVGLKGVPGVEISGNVSKGTLHILGYYIDIKDENLQIVLQRIRDGREERNHLILEKINKLGFAMEMHEVAAFAGEDVVGRPHFAQAMIAKGYVRDKDDAFGRYLAKGLSCYADRFRLSDTDAVAEILRVGGVPILSHPFTLGLSNGELRKYVAKLCEAGLKGIEVYYSEHGDDRVRCYLGLAKEFGLVVTGGSDFHGDINPRIRLGAGFGNLNISDDIVVGLEKARSL